MNPSTPEFEMSAEEAERQTNRRAFLLLGAGVLFLCVPTLLCFPEYRMALLIVLAGASTSLAMLTYLIVFMRVAELLTRLGLRKRKERFLSAEELEATKMKQKR
jgi:hypothetical protein